MLFRLYFLEILCTCVLLMKYTTALKNSTENTTMAKEVTTAMPTLKTMFHLLTPPTPLPDVIFLTPISISLPPPEIALTPQIMIRYGFMTTLLGKNVVMCRVGEKKSFISESCKDHCNDNFYNQYFNDRCSCLPECSFYGDCCVDYELFCQPRSKDNNTTGTTLPVVPVVTDAKSEPEAYEYYISRRELNMKQEYFSCVEVSVAFSEQGLRTSQYTMMGKCPTIFKNTGIFSLCEQNVKTSKVLSTPVYNKNGKLYRNKYCAFCHEETEENLKSWKSELICDNSTTNFDILSSGNITAILQYVQQEENCNFVYSIPNEDTTKNFTKPRMYQCMFKSIIRTCPSDRAIDENLEKGCRTYSNFVFGYSEGVSKLYQNSHCALCNGIEEDHLSCPSHSAGQIGGVTGNYNPTFKSISLLLDFSSSSKIQIQTAEKVFVETCEEDEVFIPEEGVCRKLVCLRGWRASNGTCLPPVLTGVSIGGIVADVPKFQPKPGILEGENFTTNVSVVHFPPSSEHLANSTSNNNASMNSSWSFDCPMVSYKTEEYESLSNKSVKILNSGKMYHVGDYFMQNKTLFVCSQYKRTANISLTTDRPMFHYIDDPVQGIINLVGMILSLLGLLVTFVTYCIFPKLRNLPGISMMHLCVALFIAQLLFLIGVDYATPIPELCAAVAIIQHYTWLVTCFWMSGMAFQVFLTFRNKTILDQDSKSRLRLYILYGWGGPLLILIPSIVIEFCGCIDLPFGYGSSTQCWISDTNAMIYSFSLPILLLITINIIFFVITIVNIKKASKHGSVASKRRDRSLFFVYVRLSSIMGFTWLIGCVAAFAKVHELWYLFIIFNTLQGLFICFAYVCNKRVLAMYSKLRLKWSNRRQNGHSSDTTKSRNLISSSTPRSSPMISRGKSMNTEPRSLVTRL